MVWKSGAVVAATTQLNTERNDEWGMPYMATGCRGYRLGYRGPPVISHLPCDYRS